MKALLALATVALTSCTVTVMPDGSREYRTDPTLFAQMIERFATSAEIQPTK